MTRRRCKGSGMGCALASGGLLERGRVISVRNSQSWALCPITAGGTGATLGGATRQSSPEGSRATPWNEGGSKRTTYISLRARRGGSASGHDSKSDVNVGRNIEGRV